MRPASTREGRLENATAAKGPPAIQELVLGGEPEPWRRLGFGVEDGRFQVGSVSLRLEPGGARGLVGWTLRGVAAGDLDGLPTVSGDDRAPGPAPEHPNGAQAVDHVVVTTPRLERTLAALAAAGLELRRQREAQTPQGELRQAFYRLGEVVLEVVAPAGASDAPAAFWGMVFTVRDLDACAAALGGLLGEVRDAVQPGRRIATVRREAGLSLPVAFMNPDPRRPAS